MVNISSFIMSSILLHISHCWEDSVFQSMNGHYPGELCQITNVLLSWQSRTFHYKSNTDLNHECVSVHSIWDVAHVPDLDQDNCDVTYDYGIVFPVYAKFGGNYFHLHYDTLIPLFSEVYFHRRQSGSVVFMPTIEEARLKKLEWETNLFTMEHKFWNQLLQAISGNHTLLPLDSRLLDKKMNLCFTSISFGTPSVSFADEELIQGFVSHIQNTFNIIPTRPLQQRVGIISRYHRRRILNEEKLISAVEKFAAADLIHFERMTFKQQVEHMQKYTVVIGVNGAGLINCLYLPITSVCIQLVPYEAHVNWRQYSTLLKSRGGPYLEWHNTHESLTRPAPGDKHKNRPDTIVHVDEFVALVKQALDMTSGNDKQPREDL